MIITLCGSARFEKLFHLWNEILTMSGHTVYGLAVYPSTKKGKKSWYTAEEKKRLDAAHFRKIDASDAIFVLNHFAYLGESTLAEIKYAENAGKTVYFLESWGKGNGIGPNHNKDYQRRAAKLGLLDFGSPIDTCLYCYKEPWDLLPEAGAFRSKMVKTIHSTTKKL